MTHPDKKSPSSDRPKAPAADVTVAEDTRQKANKMVSAPDTPRPNATFERWNAERGFGFLRMDDGRKVFCHVNDLCSELRPARGNEPDLDAKVHVTKVTEGDKGLKANGVKCLDCITPAVWEIQPVGPKLWGAREMQAICVNKPKEPSYKSPLSFNEVYEANKPFREAQEKERRWKGDLTPAFFEEFGEPETMEVTANNMVILTYSHGQKTVSAYSIYTSGHWEATHSGQWKQSKTDFSAEFVFEGLPGLTIIKQVASFGYPAHLTPAFELLAPEIQTEILTALRDSIPSTDEFAEDNWRKFLENNATNERVEKLRKNIIELQAPGAMYITKSTHRSQQEVSAGYGDERWGTGHYMDINVTNHFLVTGARKCESYSYQGTRYAGGNKFLIPEPKQDQTAEQARDILLAKKKEELQKLFRNESKISDIPADSRIYDISPEEWKARYSKRWDELQTAYEENSALEDKSALDQMSIEIEEYESAAKELREARKELESAEKRAGRFGTDFINPDRPENIVIGEASIEELQKSAELIRQFIPATEKAITAKKLETEEKNRKYREELEAKAQAQGGQVKISDGKSDESYANDRAEKQRQKEDAEANNISEASVALAEQAESILGTKAAIELLEGEYNAPYGRARRQNAVKDALGEPADSLNNRFYDFGKSRMVDSTLKGAIEHLRASGKSEEPTVAKTKSAPVYSEAPVIEAEPAKPASLSDLMGKFGGATEVEPKKEPKKAGPD